MIKRNMRERRSERRRERQGEREREKRIESKTKATENEMECLEVYTQTDIFRRDNLVM
jgi:hypothetical protein